MNNPIFWRLIWKEYRLMRSFWIAVAVLAVLLELIAWVSVWSPNDSVQMIFAMALALPAFYAMGCGATLFATEHETGTYQFQRALPVSASRLFFGKIPFGLISTPLLFLLLWVSAWIISGMRFPDADFHVGLWGLCGVAALELFLWGVFFSLLCHQPMKAAILAAIAGSTTIHVIAMRGAFQWRPEIYLETQTILYRLGVACILAVVNVWLGCRWLRGGSTTAGDGRQLGRVSIRRKLADVHRGTVATRSTILGRLAWQQWRQSSRMMVILVAMTVPLLACMVANWSMFFTRQGNDPTRTSVNLPFWVILALATAPLAGANVFMADQRQRSFRFLTERGVNSRHVWIGRHAVWILSVLSCTILLVLPWVVFPVLSWMARQVFFRVFFRDVANERMPQAVIGFVFLGGGCFAYVVGAYAAGQLSSMFFRSGILAGFLALLLSVVFVAWSVIMLGLGVPLIWSIAPIPLILLVATWLRAPHWLLERNGIKGWWSTASWLTITAGLLLAAVLTYRVYEIPLVAPGFSPEEFSRPASDEAQATAEMYRRASELIVPIAKREDTAEKESKEDNLARRKAWIDDNRKVIEMAMQASRRPECDGLEPPGRERLGEIGHGLARLLIGDARLLNADGDLDAALERYLGALRISSHIRPRNLRPYEADIIERSVCSRLKYWAARPGQTPERIRTAIQALQRLISQPPPQTDYIKVEYRVARQIIEGDTDLLGRMMSTHDDQTGAIRSVVAMQWMPWEKARAVRLLNWSTADGLTQIESIEQAIADGTSLPMVYRHRFYNRSSYRSSSQVRLYETTMALQHFHGPDWWYLEAKELVETSTQHRATCLVLALAAWKLEHGELPDTLDDLVGPYLTKLPPDPHTGEPFRYLPQGIPIAITEPDSVDDEPIDLVSAGQPFIWSTGWHISVSRTQSDRVLDKYYINDRYDSYQRPKSEYEIWRQGECFTIP
jgi:hypothetical protein